MQYHCLQLMQMILNFILCFVVFLQVSFVIYEGGLKSFRPNKGTRHLLRPRNSCVSKLFSTRTCTSFQIVGIQTIRGVFVLGILSYSAKRFRTTQINNLQEVQLRK